MNYRIIYYTLFFINITGLAHSMDRSQTETSLIEMSNSIARARRSISGPSGRLPVDPSSSMLRSSSPPQIPVTIRPTSRCDQSKPASKDLVTFVAFEGDGDDLDIASPTSGILPVCDAAASTSSSSSGDQGPKRTKLSKSTHEQLARTIADGRNAHRMSISQTERRKSLGFSTRIADPFAIVEMSEAASPVATEGQLTPAATAAIHDEDEIIPLQRPIVELQTGRTGRMTTPMIIGATNTASFLAGCVVAKFFFQPQARHTRSPLPFVSEASAVLSGAGFFAQACAGTAALLAMMAAGRGFNSWMHAACESKQELLKNAFEAIMKKKMIEHERRTVEQITDFAKQVDQAIMEDKEATRKTLGHLFDAVGHAAALLAAQSEQAAVAATATSSRARVRTVSPRAEAIHTAATELAAAAGQARSDMDEQRRRAVHIVPPTPPAKEAGCCCIIC